MDEFTHHSDIINGYQWLSKDEFLSIHPRIGWRDNFTGKNPYLILLSWENPWFRLKIFPSAHLMTSFSYSFPMIFGGCPHRFPMEPPFIEKIHRPASTAMCCALTLAISWSGRFNLGAAANQIKRLKLTHTHIHTYIYIYIYLSIHPSIYLSIYLPIWYIIYMNVYRWLTIDKGNNKR